MIPPGLAGMIKHLTTCIARVAAASLLACGVALAQSAPDVPAASTGRQNTLKLTTVLMALPAGTPWLSIRLGLTCAMDDSVKRATGGREPEDLPPYAAAFKTELERVGLKPVADDNLFNREAEAAADYQVAAVITDAHIVACVSQGGLFTGKPGDARGDGSMKVDWQVYSPVRKEVVARVSTSGAVAVQKSVSDGLAQLIVGTFASNVRALLATAEFRNAISAKAPAANDLLPTAQQSKIALLGNQKAAKQPVADAVGSVVTLQTGNASGSGVLLSDDGYILTNAHVVGDEKELRVRWSDGIEKVAQVIRVAKARDVALIKTDPRDRPPLPIARGPLSPGQRVFAIGSPKGAAFGGTVSSGVISASRTIEGLRFIQSDVSVSPGSSGGALRDEAGSLLGITVSGVDNGGRAGLNLFIPIGDAMDFLNLEQK